MKNCLRLAAALAGFAVVLSAGEARAWWWGAPSYYSGYGYGPGYRSYGCSCNRSCAGCSYHTAYFYTNGPNSFFYSPVPSSLNTIAVVAAPPADERPSFYSGPDAQGARLRISVPTEDASVWIEDRMTEQTGRERTFVSPPLAAGKVYMYKVRAVWMDGDREMTEERDVDVQAGRETLVRLGAGSEPIVPPLREPRAAIPGG